MEYFNDEPKFLDPSDWNIASYNAHPIDQIESVAAEASSYRGAALHCLQILASVDRFMSRARDLRLAWTAVSSAIGLTSTNGLAESEIARQLGVTEQALRRSVGKFV